MTITPTKENGKAILTLSGRLDMPASTQFHDVLMPALEGSDEVVLDFSDVAYVSSAGLRVLLLGQKKSKADGKSMSLTNVSADVMDVFEMTGFSDMLNIQ